MAKDLERADTMAPPLNHGSDASRIGKKLIIFAKTRFSRISRLSFQIVLAVVLLLLLVNLAPTHTEAVLGPEYSRFWKWPYSSESPAAGFNASETGPVRMVVFGTPDLWTPSRSKGNTGPGWTEALCAQIACTSHESMVPLVDLPSQALTSKTLYNDTFQNVTSFGTSTEDSGMNYQFMPEQYPVANVPDLAAQVQDFLARPKLELSPRETIWVFTLGTWDIWTLAALPREDAVYAARSIAKSVFDQIEILYEASVDRESPAFSDFFAYTSDASSILAAFNEDPHAKPVESFRIVIPRLFDISLTPGWPSLRPEPPAPHSKIEHVTNAAYLAAEWDREVMQLLKEWMSLPDRGAMRRDQPMKDGKPYFGFWNPDTNSPSSGRGAHDVLYAPFPGRAGLHVDLGELAMDAIIDAQFRSYKMVGGDGRGTADESDPVYFDEVRMPCAWDGNASPASGGVEACEDPDTHLFQGPFTMSERAIRETAKRASKKVMEVLYDTSG